MAKSKRVSGTAIATLIFWFLPVVGGKSAINAQVVGAAGKAQPITLKPGAKPLEREMKGGETHTYRIHADAGLFLHAVVDQIGIDVALTLYAPDGNKIASMDSLNGANGLEQVSTIAEAGGNYRLEVSSDKTAKTACYNVEVTPLRKPNDEDSKRIAAESMFMEATTLTQRGDAESKRAAIQKGLESLPLWHQSGDQYEEAMTLDLVGGAHLNLGDLQKALEYFNPALPLMRAVADRSGEANTLRGIGGAYFGLGEMKRALEQYNRALPLMRAIGDQSSEAFTLVRIGEINANLGEEQKALDYFTQALPLKRAVSDLPGEATTLNDIGAVYAALGDKRHAIEFYSQALPLRRLVADRVGEAISLNNIASAYSALGEKQKALEYLNQSLSVARVTADRSQEATTLGNIGAVYSDLGEKDKALEFLNQALALTRDVGDRAEEAATLNNIGLVYSDLGDKRKALKYLNECLPLRRAVGDRSGEATTLNNIGTIYSDLSETRRAIGYYDQALPLERAVEDRSGEATTLGNLGFIYSALGEKQKALEEYGEALALTRAVRDRSKEATTLTNIGVVYSDLGDKQRALEYFSQALPLRRAVGDRSGEAVNLNNIGLAYSQLGDKQKPLEYFNQALSIERDVADRSAEATELTNIGTAYSMRGETQKALDLFNQALPLRRAVEDRDGEAATLNDIGLAYSSIGEEQKALEFYSQALSLERDVADRFGEAKTLGNMELDVSGSYPDLAILFGKQAVNVLQSIRRDNKGLQESLRSSYESSIEAVYRYLANLLVERNRFGEAEEVLDLLKDKEASDFIRRDSVSDQLHSATLLDSEKKALDRYDKIADQVGSLGGKKAVLLAKADKGQLTPVELAEEAKIDRDLDAANLVLNKFLTEEEKALAPASAEAKRVGELKEAEGLQDALAKLGPDVVAIYTLVTPDKYVALLVTPGTRKAYTSPIKVDDLNKKIFEFRQQLQNPASDPRPLAQELYGIVFPEGLRHDLDTMNATTIMWSIDSTLRYIPFAALYNGHQYLVASFRQSLITPASLPYLTEEPLRQWTGIGFGVSDGAGGTTPLPSVTGELHGIFRETADGDGPIPGVVLLNAAFTHQSFADDLRKQRNPVVHIATHFDSRPGVAANSSLLLGDGALSLAEIEAQTRLFNGVDLLTLSACNTAFTNQSEDGREVDSFGTIAQRLGAKGVIASLWSVDDDSTASLMQTMYRLRQQTPGMTKDEALRQAQLALANGELKPHPTPGASDRGALPNRPTMTSAAKDWTRPYYWAPFILIGNWK